MNVDGIASARVVPKHPDRRVVPPRMFKGKDGYAVLAWSYGGRCPEGVDPEELRGFLEAAVETYVSHVEENGDASGLLPK